MSEPLLLCADGGSTRLVVAAVRGTAVLAEAESVATAAHGVAILSLVDDVTARAGLTRGAYDALAMAAGPGSFTGLRTALSTFKGVALGWHKPLVGVSTLHALARSVAVPSGALVCACLDARKGEVYAALYRLGDRVEHDETILERAAVAPAELAAKLRDIAGPIHWSGDGLARFPSEFQGLVDGSLPSWPRAVPAMSAVAALALPRAATGDLLATLEPIYVRRSYADLSLGQKPAAGKGTP